MKTTIDLNYLLLPIGFLIHGIAISISGFLILFCNDVKTIGFVSFIIFLVFIQTLMYGCLLNKLENNATMKLLIDIGIKCLNLKSKPRDLIEDLPNLFFKNLSKKLNFFFSFDSGFGVGAAESLLSFFLNKLANGFFIILCNKI